VRGLFVSGTDTGVGKTVLAAAIAAAMAAAGEPVRVLKPLLTGLDDPPDPDWPPDHELLALAAGCDPSEVVLRTFGPAVSPHLAAELSGEPLDGAALVREIRGAAGDGTRPLLVEGVGGLLVPLGEGYDVRRLAAEVGLPVVLAARPGLGTINHTLLTVEAARRAGLRLLAVVFTPWPERPSVMERSNRDTVARLGCVPVCGLAPLEAATLETLRAAGARLPLREWFGTVG
jgi:dethiobiotin synthetase